MLWIIIIALIIVLDQVTKYLVFLKIPYGELVPVIDNFFFLTYHHNQGAAWGILQNGRYFLIAITIVALAAMIYMITKNKTPFLRLSLSVLIGGAVGNLIDRVKAGGVTDFLDFYIGQYHFPTFNVADIGVTVGAILLMIYMIFIYKEAPAGNTKPDTREPDGDKDDEKANNYGNGS